MRKVNFIPFVLAIALALSGCNNKSEPSSSLEDVKTIPSDSQSISSDISSSSSAIPEPVDIPKESLPLPEEWVGEYVSPDGDKLSISSPTEVFFGGEQIPIEHVSTFAFGYNKAGHYVQLTYSAEKNDKQQTVHTIVVVVSDVTKNPPVTLVEYVKYTRIEGEPVVIPAPESKPASTPSESIVPPISVTPEHHLVGTYTGSYTFNGVEDYNLSVSLGITVQKGNLYALYSESGEGYGTNAPYDRPPTLGKATDFPGNTLNFVAVKLVNGQYGPSDQPFADVSVTFDGKNAQLTITHHWNGATYNVALTRIN